MTITINENKPKRRDKLIIIAEIIDIASKGTSKTHIMFKANLSFSQLNQYLELLIQTELLERSTCGGKEVYRATQRGIEFMEKQCQIVSFLNIDAHQNNIKTSFDFSTYNRSKLFL